MFIWKFFQEFQGFGILVYCNVWYLLDFKINIVTKEYIKNVRLPMASDNVAPTNVLTSVGDDFIVTNMDPV